MTSRKNQNSILVLATLGVYLGLVLAGATPQVLASAAMTRQFDVKDEIEFKDDLDTKPDDERSPVTASVQIYLEGVEHFLASLGNLKNKGKFDPNIDTLSVSQTTLLPCVDSNLAVLYTCDLYSIRSTDKLRRSVIEHTTFRTENDQVFVITRLPRAGLASLLK